jgi:hypothetical protein
MNWLRRAAVIVAWLSLVGAIVYVCYFIVRSAEIAGLL